MKINMTITNGNANDQKVASHVLGNVTVALTCSEDMNWLAPDGFLYKLKTVKR